MPAWPTETRAAEPNEISVVPMYSSISLYQIMLSLSDKLLCVETAHCSNIKQFCPNN